MLDFFKLCAVFKVDAGGTGSGIPASTETIADGLTNTITLLASLIGSLSVIAIIIGGIMFAISNGDPKRIKTARDTVMYAVIGLVVSFAAYAIVYFVAGALKG